MVKNKTRPIAVIIALVLVTIILILKYYERLNDLRSHAQHLRAEYWPIADQITLSTTGIPDTTGEGESKENAYAQVVQMPEHLPFERDPESAKIWYQWKNDSECSRYSVTLGKNISVIPLVSFPRSGNTWFRYLLEGATGIFTGASAPGHRLLPYGLLGSVEDPKGGAVLTIKHHSIRKSSLTELTPVLFIIRNPEQSIESYFVFGQYGKQKPHEAIGDASIFENKVEQFDMYVRSHISGWEHLANNVLDNAHLLHVIRYEELKANPMLELSKAMHFMRIPEDVDRMRCVEKHLDGVTNRGQPEYNPYTDDQRQLITEAVQRVSAKFVERGLAPLSYAT